MGKIMTLDEMAFVRDTEELRLALRNGICEFVYTKKDKSRRTAFGTTNSTILDDVGGNSSSFGSNVDDPRREGIRNAGYISYYDLEKKGWRNCQARNDMDVDLIATYETIADLLKAHPGLTV